MSAIKVENLTFIYSKGTPFEKVALDNVSVEIEKGAFVGIIGHTGSGKSTLLQNLNGLLKPESGSVYINGEDIWEKKDKRHIRFDVGLVFQYPEYQLFEETVFKDIAFGPLNMGLSLSEVETRVRESIKFVGLGEDILDKSPFDLSGGQKRRVAIAGVIAMRPKILILDEPTAGLDPKGRDEILSHIKEYHKENKTTVLLSSHSMEDIAKNAKKVLVLNQAKIEMFEKIDKVFAKADRLEEIGLSIPQITKIFLQLKKKGYHVNTNIYTTKQALDEILRVRGAKNA